MPMQNLHFLWGHEDRCAFKEITATMPYTNMPVSIWQTVDTSGLTHA